MHPTLHPISYTLRHRNECTPPYTLNPTPQIFIHKLQAMHEDNVGPMTNHNPYTIHPKLSSQTPKPEALDPQLSTLAPSPNTLHPTPYTLCPTCNTTHFKSYTLNPKSTLYTLHPEPYNPHPKSQAPNCRRCTQTTRAR